MDLPELPPLVPPWNVVTLPLALTPSIWNFLISGGLGSSTVKFSTRGYVLHAQILFMNSILLRVKLALFASTAADCLLEVSRCRGCVVGFVGFRENIKRQLNNVFCLNLPVMNPGSAPFPTWDSVKLSDDALTSLIIMAQSNQTQVRCEGLRALSCSIGVSSFNRGVAGAFLGQLSQLVADIQEDDDCQFWANRLGVHLGDV